MILGTDLVRVRASDKEKLNRLSGAMKAATGDNVTVGDVVAEALVALIAVRPELAPIVAAVDNAPAVRS